MVFDVTRHCVCKELEYILCLVVIILKGISMKFSINYSVVLLALTLVGCGSTGGIIKIGADTYNLSASRHNTFGGAAAKTNALESATDFCEKMKKELSVKTVENSFEPPFYTSSVTFNCL